MAAGLRLDWCSHAAAKYAVEHWHYSKSMPTGAMVRVGAWEDGGFIGCVLFSRGSAINLLKPYGLDVTEGCELTRVALTTHAAPVSRIVAVAVRLLKKSNPGLRLVVSFADPAEGHVGAIYQAGNWVYSGTTTPRDFFADASGKVYHPRMVSVDGTKIQYGKARACPKFADLTRVKKPPKHRYLMPLDDEMRARIAPLAKPYPKRPS